MSKVLLLSLVMSLGACAGAQKSLTNADADEAIRAAFPTTTISSVDCDGYGGLCEVIAGTQVFYADPTAKFLLIGHIFDIESNANLTRAKLNALDPSRMIEGAAAAKPADAPNDPFRAQPKLIDINQLPETGYVEWGPKDGTKLVLFSAFSCPHCTRFHPVLAQGHYRVREYFVDTRMPGLAQAVLCSDDPAAALSMAYNRKLAPATDNCGLNVLRNNLTFFSQNNFRGTPLLINEDGAVRSGALTLQQLQAWAQPRSKTLANTDEEPTREDAVAKVSAHIEGGK